MQIFNVCTSHNQGLGLEGILEADHQGLSEGIDHGEQQCCQHPDPDQLDIGGAWQGLADAQEAAKHVLAIALHSRPEI